MSDDLNEYRAKMGLQTYVEGTRSCLSCGISFNSWGKGNRICDTCKANREHEEVSYYRFDDSTVKSFQYDLPLSEIMEYYTVTGSYSDAYDSKGFYRDEAQTDYRKKP